MEYVTLYNNAMDELKILKQYIERVEAERDYYQDASFFAGAPNTPKPEVLKQQE